MGRRPNLPYGYHDWPIEKRRQWVDDYNTAASLKREKRAKTFDTRLAKREAEFAKLKDMPTPTGFQWLNTQVDPRKPATGFDAGRTSWKFHAVMADPKESFQQLEERYAMSICGILPAHGWTLDLFMDEDDAVAGKCLSCLKKLEKWKTEETK